MKRDSFTRAARLGLSCTNEQLTAAAWAAIGDQDMPVIRRGWASGTVQKYHSSTRVIKRTNKAFYQAPCGKDVAIFVATLEDGVLSVEKTGLVSWRA